MNVDERREALEAISVSAEATVQERLRALEMLRELGDAELLEPRPDFAEQLADEPDRLSRVIELADEYLFADLPAYRERVERRALEIVEERALERRADFAVVASQTAQDAPEPESPADESPASPEAPRAPESRSGWVEPGVRRGRQAKPFGGRPPRASS